MAFKEIKAEELTWNPFTQIGKGWFLVTAGDEKASNTMTVSWGCLGVWWGKDAATIYIRQNRCTKEFIDAKETFTISSLPESYKKELGYMGSHSGHDGDKWEACGLHPYPVDGTCGVAEADVILVCRKMLQAKLDDKTFLDPSMEKRWYDGKEAGNFHTMYIGAIEKVLVKE